MVVSDLIQQKESEDKHLSRYHLAILVAMATSRLWKLFL
jgi:hypothetical protein